MVSSCALSVAVFYVRRRVMDGLHGEEVVCTFLVVAGVLVRRLACVLVSLPAHPTPWTLLSLVIEITPRRIPPTHHATPSTHRTLIISYRYLWYLIIYSKSSYMSIQGYK